MFKNILKFNNKLTIHQHYSRQLNLIRLYSKMQQQVDRSNLFVSPKWLNENLEKVKILDASWFMAHEKRDARKEFTDKHIKSSKLFDIDEICDKQVQLPHNLPSVEFFEKEMKRLGINNDDHIVIYDTRGQYVASARVWWTFLVFGHNASKVSLLEGGLPAWESNGLPTESGEIKSSNSTNNYKAKFNQSLVKNKDEILENLSTKKYQLVDARSADRFWGRVDEPRPGLKRGHIPQSLNIPWTDIIDSNKGYIPKDKLLQTFKDKGIELDQDIATTCGSGTTAAVLSLGLYSLGYPIAPIYDGSWSEWGQPQHKLPTSCSGDQ